MFNQVMGMVRKERTALIAIIGLWQLFVLRDALAGQPLDKLAAALNHASNPGRQVTVPQIPSERLDLRPPAQFLAVEDSTEADPDWAHHKLMKAQNALGLEARATAAGAWLSGAWRSRAAPPTSSTATGHIMSPMETLAHNFRQEGLPLARLFQNKDSLVHLGLNQKGKPGLWILHKLH